MIPRPKSLPGALVPVLLGLGLLLLLLPGCGPAAPEPVDEGPPPMTEEEIAAERMRARTARHRDTLRRIRQRIDKNPQDFANNRRLLEILLIESEKTPVQAEAQSLLAEEDERFARLVKAKLDELLPDVERLKQAEDWSGAEEKLGEFERVAAIDPERYLKTAALKAFNDEIDEVILLSKAEAEFKKLSRKARAYKRQEELAKAIGFLESFPEDYSNTSYHAKIREQVDEYLVLYKAAKEKEQATLSIEWEQVEIDKYLSSFTKHQAQDAEVWAGVDGTVEGVNDSDGMAQLEVGTDDWKEWILELEVKVPDDQDLNLGITSGIPPGRRDKNYERQRLEVETDTWITLRVEIREGIVKIIDVKSLENIKEPYAPYFSSGSFAVMLQPGEKVFLRNIRYKTLTKAGAENGEAGGEDEEVGDGEGGDGEGDGDAR